MGALFSAGDSAVDGGALAGGFDSGAVFDAEGVVGFSVDGATFAGVLSAPAFIAGEDAAGVFEETGESAPFFSIRGTISAARTSVPAAPTKKYFSEPPDARASGTRRGAAIVTFTLGSDETGTCDGALPRVSVGETGDRGT